MSSLDRIDTHFHLVLDCYVEALKNAGGDPSGKLPTMYDTDSRPDRRVPKDH